MPKITTTKRSHQSLGFHPYRTNKEEDDEVKATKININAPTASKKTSIEDDSDDDDKKDGSGGLSRGQKKRQERKDKVMQKLGLKQPQLKNQPPSANNNTNQTNKPQPSQSQQQSLEKAQAILLSTLDEMQEESMDTEAVEERHAREQAFLALATSSAAISTNKLKKEVAIRESNRIKQVQKHPSFQENPINAIQQHLQQMVGKSAPTVVGTMTINSSNKKKGNK